MWALLHCSKWGLYMSGTESVQYPAGKDEETRKTLEPPHLSVTPGTVLL